ncbi:polyprenol monophosphomannose synthase [uncultured Pseudokineococcus sp.]|uniref:polyprenol monophosphomannose synthase n=1 Tax=uncultured Pseudokineococcus sp. TaxID=1642928 RepID=UPI00261047A8|nr:polyprenol monophosphomannose synthase [uncultured Pseudokineococcus sp.]
MRALVVVPVYDEAATIGALLDGVLAADEDVDVLVVDDGSPDGTGDLVAARPEPRVHLLRRATKDGLGAAYRAGFAWARERRYDVVVEMDADLSHPADRLPALLRAVGPGGADLAIGSRYVEGGGTRGWPLHRRLLSRGGNAYIGAALRLGVRDATAGFRAFRAPLLARIGVARMRSTGYCFQVETTLRAVTAGARVVEVPITFVERAAGRSKMGPAIVGEAVVRVTWWALLDLRRRLAARA